MSGLRWVGGAPECPHERREVTVEGIAACANCGALLLEEDDEEAQTPDEVQVKYILRGRLGAARVCGEWEDSKLARLAAEGIRAHGGQAAVLKITTEKDTTGV